MRSNRRRVLFIAPLALLGLALFIFLGGEIVMWLWNWLLPPLFAWPQLTFWQALALLALCRILFGGFGRQGFSGSGVRRRIAERIGERIEERMQHMTAEERERFRQGMRGRCGFDASTGESKGQ
jgi:hypothetical protein